MTLKDLGVCACDNYEVAVFGWASDTDDLILFGCMRTLLCNNLDRNSMRRLYAICYGKIAANLTLPE